MGTLSADRGIEEARPYQTALAQAMRYLAAREHSERELVGKLSTKGHSVQVIQQVLGYLKDAALQSDQRFLESFLRSRLAKGYGPMVIRNELRQRGIDDELLDAEMTQTGCVWAGIAERARDKRFGPSGPDTRDDWNRQARFLARRGFPSDLIYRVLGEHRD